MKLRYIFGGSGSGKLTYCIEQILKRNNPSMLIVPEQFTLQAEKLVIEKSKSKVLFDIYVLNFKKLARIVLKEKGYINKIPLEDMGQTMVLRKILSELGEKKQLSYFPEKSYYNIGLLDKVLETLKEFLQTNINLLDFEYIIEQTTDENFKNKLKDIKLIYERYKEFLENEYITDETIIDILAKDIKDFSFINSDLEVFLYGFEGFNNQELNVLEELFKICYRVNICFSINSNKTYFEDINMFDNYFYTKTTINKIHKKIVNILGVEIEKPLYLKEDKRHEDNEELLFLRENFLKYKPKKYSKNPENIKIFSCKNKYDEIENLAYNIIELVKNNDYSYKDIAVILADEKYQKNIKIIFNKYDIPYFLDDKKKIANHSLVELIICALDIILYNFRYDNIFRYLRTGFFEIENGINIKKEDIDILENYVIKYGIKGKKWLEDFEYGFYENSIYNFDNINNTRRIFLKSIQKLDFNKTKKYTVIEISEKIVEFLNDLNITDNLLKFIERDEKFYKEGYIKNAGLIDEHIQVFNCVFQTLQKLVDILGDEKLKLDEYIKILKSTFEKQTISIVPPTQDEVLIGDFNRTRLANNKVLFCVAMNEGNIPKYNNESAFISDEEKLGLIAKGIELKPTGVATISGQMLSIYNLMLKASDKLYLSYSISELDGKAKKPSIIISKIEEIFKNIDIYLEEEGDKNIYCPDRAFDTIFKKLNDDKFFDEDAKEIFAWFLESPKYREKIDNITKGIAKIENINKEVIEERFLDEIYKDKNLSTSVSKLEEFRKCPFSYFLKYILNIKDRDNNILDFLTLGNIYHSVLEEFSNRILKDMEKVQNIKDEEIYIVLGEIIEEMSKQEEISNLFDIGPKYRYYLNRIKNIVFISSKALIEQIREGKFEPKHFEIDFDRISNYKKDLSINLDSGYKMNIKGKIDRVDKFFDDEKEYIKIMDYKSSDKDLSLDKVYYGLQLQLLTYLDIFVKMEQSSSPKEVLPAGAFYFEVKEEILKDGMKEDKITEEFNLKGILLDNDKVKKAVGEKTNSKGKSVCKVSTSSIFNQDEFSKILKLANILVKEISNEIVKGDIKVYPYKYKIETGCNYCNYKDICNFDIMEKEQKYNCFKAIEKAQIFSKIDEKIRKSEEE